MHLLRLFSCAWLAFLVSAPAHAALGDVPSDFGVTPSQQAAAPGVTTLVSILPSGTRVSEYVGSDGRVFAVSWRGPFLPDFSRLLGPSFERMRLEALSKPKAGSGPLSLNSPELQLQSGGAPRNFHGRAWLPASLPAGFSPEALQ